MGLFLVLDGVGADFRAWKVLVLAYLPNGKREGFLSRRARTRKCNIGEGARKGANMRAERDSSLTIYLGREADCVEGGPADRAGVGVVGPTPDAPIMHNMVATDEGCYEMVLFSRCKDIFFVVVCRLCFDGGLWLWLDALETNLGGSWSYW